jgi:hypothetical protein
MRFPVRQLLLNGLANSPAYEPALTEDRQQQRGFASSRPPRFSELSVVIKFCREGAAIPPIRTVFFYRSTITDRNYMKIPKKKGQAA